MIHLTSKGNYSKTTKYLQRLKQIRQSGILEKYGEKGISVLASATPVDTGLTASSWNYRIDNSKGKATITFTNSNIQNGVPIAIILQYGHGTGTGGWVQGRDYINPAIQPVFDQIVIEAWKEVTSI